MHYTIYKITNLVDNKIYIGAHKTNNLNDGYMGSGKYLKYAQEKYGIENFQKELLFIFNSSNEMYAKEKELVNEDFLITQNTYNLRIGGIGGWDYLNSNSDIQRRKAIASNKMQKWFAENDPLWMGAVNKAAAASKTMKQNHINGKINYITFLGKSHTEDTKNKMSIKARERLTDSTKNSQYGTMWITDGNKNKKIKKIDFIPEGWYKGRIVPR